MQEHLSLKKYIIDIVVESTAPAEPLRDGEERQRSKRRAKKIKARMHSRYLNILRQHKRKTASVGSVLCKFEDDLYPSPPKKVCSYLLSEQLENNTDEPNLLPLSLIEKERIDGALPPC